MSRRQWLSTLVLSLLIAGWCVACTGVHTKPPGPAGETPLVPEPVYRVQYGVASWYGAALQGRLTASGEPFDMHQYTAAHRTAPFGTTVLVTNLDNGQTVQVRINDRGPAARDRLLDLSYAAARQLDMLRRGTVRVKMELLGDTGPPLPSS